MSVVGLWLFTASSANGRQGAPMQRQQQQQQ